MKRVLVIEDDPVIRANVLELLEAEGFEGVGAPDGKAGIAAALSRTPDLIVCDIMMPVLDGHQVIRQLRDYPETATVPFIFLTARAQRSDIREGMNLGADDYITKPFTRNELLESIRTRLRRQEVQSAGRTSWPGGSASPTAEATARGAVIEAPAMRELYAQAMSAAATHISVLILGETGVGKDVLAHAIHKGSLRRDEPFVPLNCAALAETLLESELFGHEKGAFTGAVQASPGLFESADGGTVFLDEIGDLPRSTQVKLLRVLEDRRVMRVGGRTAREVDVRFIAATNRDLEDDIGDGKFRQDLFFRIAGLTLTIPPLRERREEIRPLSERFVANTCRQIGRVAVPRLTEDTLLALERYDWPGNVRELRNVIERAVALAKSDALVPELLPPNVLAAPADRSSVTGSPLDRLREEMREVERKRIIEALDRCGGNQTKAAEVLGMSRRTLLHRLDELDLPRPRKKT